MPATLKRPTTKKTVAQCRRAVEEWTSGGFEVDLLGGKPRVDEAENVIRGVKILGVWSRNKAKTIGLSAEQFGAAAEQQYGYAIEAMHKSKGMYEGASVFCDHTLLQYLETGQRIPVNVDQRRTAELMGWLENVQVVETGDPEVDGLYGDFNVLRSNSLSSMVFEVANRRPDKLALSHEAFFGDARIVDGRVVLHEITKVDAVALTCNRPGTTNSLFEDHAGERPMPKTTIRKLCESMAKANKAKAIFEEMLGDPGLASMGDAQLEMPEAEASPDSEAAIKAAIRSAVMAVFDDANLDTSATVAKIKQLLAFLDKITGTQPPPNTPVVEGDDEEEKKPKEGGEAAESMATVDRSPIVIESVDMLATAGVPAKRSIIESMLGLRDTAARQAYVNDLKGIMPVKAAAESAAPGPIAGPLEAPAPRSQAGGGAAPKAATAASVVEDAAKDPKEFAAILRGVRPVPTLAAAK